MTAPPRIDHNRDATTQPGSPETRPGSTRAVVRHLRELARSLDEHSRWVETQCGLSALQLGALRALAETPGMKVSELAATLLIHQSTASNMLDKLEARGLLHRQRVGPDQRVVRLHLTPAGTALLATAPQPEQGGLNAALRQLPPSTLARLAGDLGEVVANLQQAKGRAVPAGAHRQQDEPTSEGTT